MDEEKQEYEWNRISDFLKHLTKSFLVTYAIIGITLGYLFLRPGQNASIGLLVFVGIISFIIAIYYASKKVLEQIEEAREKKEAKEKLEKQKQKKETKHE